MLGYLLQPWNTATTNTVWVSSVDKKLKKQLSRFIDGRVCLLGIGNRHQHDDGIGSCLAEALEARSEFDVIDAGIVPENHMEMVARRHPDSILMVDATDFGG